MPVLGSSVGENWKFIRDGVNGFLCDSPEAYRNAMSKVAAMSDAVYQQMSREAAASSDSFSMEKIAQEFIAISTEPS